MAYIILYIHMKVQYLEAGHGIQTKHIEAAHYTYRQLQVEH